MDGPYGGNGAVFGTRLYALGLGAAGAGCPGTAAGRTASHPPPGSTARIGFAPVPSEVPIASRAAGPEARPGLPYCASRAQGRNAWRADGARQFVRRSSRPENPSGTVSCGAFPGVDRRIPRPVIALDNCRYRA